MKKGYLEFEMKNIVVVDIDELADELWDDIAIVLHDSQDLTYDEIDVIDFNAVKKAVARKWLEE